MALIPVHTLFPQRPPQSGRDPRWPPEENPLLHSDAQDTQSSTHPALLTNYSPALMFVPKPEHSGCSWAKPIIFYWPVYSDPTNWKALNPPRLCFVKKTQKKHNELPQHLITQNNMESYCLTQVQQDVTYFVTLTSQNRDHSQTRAWRLVKLDWSTQTPPALCSEAALAWWPNCVTTASTSVMWCAPIKHHNDSIHNQRKRSGYKKGRHTPCEMTLLLIRTGSSQTSIVWKD